MPTAPSPSRHLSTPAERRRPALIVQQPSHASSSASVPRSASFKHPESIDTQPQKPAQGLRAHLHHLLPRHALFYVSVQIHEINNIPLVSGEFGARWKFRNVQPVSWLGSKHQQALAALKDHLHEQALAAQHDKAKVQSVEEIYQKCLSQDSVPTRNSLSSSSSSSHSDPSTRPNIPSVVVSDLQRTPSITSVDSGSITGSMRPPSSASKSVSSVEGSENSHSQTPNTEAHGTRGITAYLPLQEHRVRWEKHIDAVVKMDVDRDTHQLLEHNFKVSVVQHIIPGDPSMPSNPRLGYVRINLAEYADEGPVTRRHLLSDSKTNATLKLTILVQHLESDKVPYISPPLPKADILGGITGLLDDSAYNNIPRRTRAAARDRVFTDRFGTPALLNGRSQFDVTRVPYAVGPRSTEILIEALFNPKPTPSLSVDDPFHYYHDQEEDAKSIISDETHSSVDHWVGVDASRPSAPARISLSNSSTSDEAAPKLRWWKASRPATPATVN